MRDFDGNTMVLERRERPSGPSPVTAHALRQYQARKQTEEILEMRRINREFDLLAGLDDE